MKREKREEEIDEINKLRQELNDIENSIVVADAMGAQDLKAALALRYESLTLFLEIFDEVSKEDNAKLKNFLIKYCQNKDDEALTGFFNEVLERTLLDKFIKWRDEFKGAYEEDLDLNVLESINREKSPFFQLALLTGVAESGKLIFEEDFASKLELLKDLECKESADLLRTYLDVEKRVESLGLELLNKITKIGEYSKDKAPKEVDTFLTDLERISNAEAYLGVKIFFKPKKKLLDERLKIKQELAELKSKISVITTENDDDIKKTRVKELKTKLLLKLEASKENRSDGDLDSEDSSDAEDLGAGYLDVVTSTNDISVNTALSEAKESVKKAEQKLTDVEEELKFFEELSADELKKISTAVAKVKEYLASSVNDSEQDINTKDLEEGEFDNSDENDSDQKDISKYFKPFLLLRAFELNLEADEVGNEIIRIQKGGKENADFAIDASEIKNEKSPFYKYLLSPKESDFESLRSKVCKLGSCISACNNNESGELEQDEDSQENFFTDGLSAIREVQSQNDWGEDILPNCFEEVWKSRNEISYLAKEANDQIGSLIKGDSIERFLKERGEVNNLIQSSLKPQPTEKETVKSQVSNAEKYKKTREGWFRLEEEWRNDFIKIGKEFDSKIKEAQARLNEALDKIKSRFDSKPFVDAEKIEHGDSLEDKKEQNSKKILNLLSKLNGDPSLKDILKYLKEAFDDKTIPTIEVEEPLDSQFPEEVIASNSANSSPVVINEIGFVEELSLVDKFNKIDVIKSNDSLEKTPIKMKDWLEESGDEKGVKDYIKKAPSNKEPRIKAIKEEEDKTKLISEIIGKNRNYERFVHKEFRSCDMKDLFRATFLKCTFDEKCQLPTDLSSLEPKYFSECKIHESLFEGRGDLKKKLGIKDDQGKDADGFYVTPKNERKYIPKSSPKDAEASILDGSNEKLCNFLS